MCLRQALVRAEGRIEVLVSNAGTQIVEPGIDLSLADEKRLLAIHLDWRGPAASLTRARCI
jgi:short-subunit dehydrogenase